MAEDSRREKDLSLVEEFETVRAITSDGRSVQVPKSKFGGNLEVASANVLGGIKADEKSDSYTQEVKIDPLTGKLFVPQGEGTPPDDEDITVAEIEGTGKLQFKDKKYNASSFSGLGRTYLRKNLVSAKNVLTQAMFANEDGSAKGNTRYVIQYDYDLKGATIEVPDGCVLDFEGGSLKNGVLRGDIFTIKSEKYKIFSNVSFQGAVTENIKFSIDWFIPREYTYSIAAKIAVQDYINEAFNSGVKNLEFSSDRFYYVTETLTIDKRAIKLHSDSDINWEHSSRTLVDLRGCIHSDKVVTILDYKYKSSSNFDYTPYIGNLFFLCNKTFTSSDDTTTPIVRFSNYNYYSLWGVTINCNVYGRQLVNGALNYTGIEINTVEPERSIAFVTMKGNIQQTYYGIRVNRCANTYINTIDIWGCTKCVIGGVFQANAIQIYGGHQPQKIVWPSMDEWYRSGYFECDESMISIYGYVWDVAKGQTYSSSSSLMVRNTVKTGVTKVLNNSELVFDDRSRLLETNGSIQRFPIGKYLSCSNVLNKWNSANKNGFLGNVTYTINGEDILTSNLIWLYNSHILFNGEGNLGMEKEINPYLYDIDMASVWAKSAMNAEFNIKLVLNRERLPQDQQMDVPLIFRNRVQSTITIESNGEVIDSIVTNTDNSYYFNSAVYIEDLFRDKTLTTVTVNISFTINMGTSKAYQLPHVLIPIAKQRLNYAGTKRPYFDTISADKQIGFCYFDTSNGKPIWWNGSKWVDATGTEI